MSATYDELQKKMHLYLSSTDVELVHKAYLYASIAHDGQIRKSGEPYIIHPIAVSQILASQNLPASVLIAGLLHDVVEDTSVTEQDIKNLFGEDVADIVEGVTKLGHIEGLSSDQIQAENHRKIILATSKDIRVILVKLADRVHNMKTIQFMNESKQKVIANETLEVYAPIAHRLGMYGMKWELEDLAFRCINREAYDEIASELNMKRSEREEIVDNVIEYANKLLKNQNIDAKLYGRTKHIYSIYTSMRKNSKSFDELTDLFGFRIVVDTIPQCYSVLGIIHENFKPIPLRFKDYIPTPKHNLYQSIHTTVITANGIQVEFQIRTKSMDLIAEHGIASHWMYKEDIDANQIQSTIDDQLSWLKHAIENIDDSTSSQFMYAVKEDYLSKSIIVYTPKGDVIEIPEGSTVLDFAYYVHTKIGHQAVSGKVNDQFVTLFYPLKIGDVVQVITSKASEPSISSILKVKTIRASDSLKKYFKNMEKQKVRNEGYKALISYAIDQGLLDIKEKITSDCSNDLLVHFSLKSFDDFYYDIGVGELNIADIIEYITKKNINKKPVEANGCDVVYIQNAKQPHSFKMCRMCSPLPGDKIKATKNLHKYGMHEYFIHRNECLTGNEEILSAVWKNNPKTDVFVARLTLQIKDQPGSVAKVLAALSSQQNNILSVYFRNGMDEIGVGRASIEFPDLKTYDLVANELLQLDNVISVKRLIDKKVDQ
ncbi:MAG: RelA/SpoT family protein [Mycoplasmatales bacterium]